MEELTHLSLFSGIGGLDIAAERAGFRTVGQCEYADYPTKVLEKHWPEVPRWKDIRTLTKESFYERTGRRTVDVISGGFPCQPFSVAGKQRGKKDDRYLWPEMVRVIKELRPTWVVGENVAGIINMALADILSELEREGYRTRTFFVPACAVGAPHRRYRVAIVARNSDSEQRDKGKKRKVEEWENSYSAGIHKVVGDTEYNGLSSSEITRGIKETSGREPERKEAAGELKRTSESEDLQDVANAMRSNGKGCGASSNEAGNSKLADGSSGGIGGWRTEPGLGGMADGIRDWMDGYWDIEPDISRVTKEKRNRINRLKCLGNAVVPQQFFPIFQAISYIEFMNKKIQIAKKERDNIAVKLKFN